MDLETITNALKKWVSAATGISEDLVLMEHEPRPHTGVEAFARMTLSVTPIGADEITHAEIEGAPTGRELSVTVRGDRKLTLAIVVETLSQAPAETALSYLERARTRFGFLSLRSILSDANVGFARAETTQDFSRVRDGHMYSAASMDVHFVTRVTEQDKPITYIERATTVGTVTEGITQYEVPAVFQVAEAPAP